MARSVTRTGSQRIVDCSSVGRAVGLTPEIRGSYQVIGIFYFNCNESVSKRQK